ncbi:CpsK [Streptococcus iniae]|nr:CpsK [Streptococcus iniae]ATX39597.1 Putative glycosyltransferase EpsE [Streptococcus iniae]
MTMITVCMATFNGEKYIEEQIISILSQLNDYDELIISDDGSTDSTVEIIKKIDDKRINLVFNKNDRGYSSNFYNAMSMATGDYIFLSDQDDIWLEDKVTITLKYLKSFDFVVSDAFVVDSNLNLLEESRFKTFNISNGFLPNFIRTRYIGCCMAFNRKVLDALYPFPEKKYNIPHDLWITLISEKYYKTSLIDNQLIKYRRHDNNVSNGGLTVKNNKRSFFQIIKSRIIYLYLLEKQKGKIKNGKKK